MLIPALILYMIFSTLVALLIKNRRFGFWYMFSLSLLFTPLIVALVSFVFRGDDG